MAGASTTKTISPELFLTRQQHLDFRGYTHLLSVFDHLDYDPDFKQAETRSRDRYEHVTKKYANTLVRHSRDAVAIKIYGSTIAVVNNGVVDGGKLIIRSDNVEATPSDSITQLSNMHVNATILSSAASGLESCENIIEFVLKKTTQAREQKLNEIPFIDHVAYHLSLLRSCHNATTDEEFDRAQERFSDYVLFSSIDKTGSRLGIADVCNFRDILTKNGMEISNERYDEKISPELAGLSPSKRQSSLRRCFYKACKYSGQDAEILSKRPVYDEKGRWEFQKMLLVVVEAVYISHKKLSEQMESLKQTETVDCKVRIPEIIKLYDEFQGKLSALHRFLDAFDVGGDDRNPLLAHLQWLFDASGARNQRDKTDLFKTADEREEVSRVNAAALRFNSEEEDDGDPEDIAQLKKLPWPQAARKFLRIVNLQSDSVARATSIGPDDRKNSPKRRHESGIVTQSTVAALDVRFSEWDHTRTSLATCIDQLIDYHARTNGGKESHLNKEEILEYLYHHGVPPVKGAMSDEERQKLEDDFRNEAVFRGGMHCEALFLATMVCASREDIAKDMDPETKAVECPGLVIADTAVFEMKKASRQLISAAKRCCPACGKIVEGIAKINPEGFGSKLKHVLSVQESQTKWTAAALPPCLPATIASPVLEYVKTKALEVLIEVQAKVERRKEIFAASMGYRRESSPTLSDCSDDEDLPNMDELLRGKEKIGFTVAEKCQREISSGHPPWNTPDPEIKTPNLKTSKTLFSFSAAKIAALTPSAKHQAQGEGGFTSSPPPAIGGNLAVRQAIRQKETHRVTDETGEEPVRKKEA